MGYSVNVEPERLRTTANAIRQYITTHQNKMDNMNREIVSLRDVEYGSEFDAFQSKWSVAYGSASTSAKMLACLRSYADYLSDCATYYERVQNNARGYAKRIG